MNEAVILFIIAGVAVLAYYVGRKKGKDKAYADMFDGVGSGAYNRDGGLRGDREPPRK